MKKFLLTEVNLDDPKYLVRRRLDFVKKLNSLSEKFDNIKDITVFGDRGFIYESFQDYQALRFYLLLTCFDVLGQCEEYNDFTKWIEERNNPARDELIRSLSEESPLEICRKINEKYNKTYGTRKSFYRFINSVMSESNRDLLLESILIRKIGSGLDLFKDENGKTTKKGGRREVKTSVRSEKHVHPQSAVYCFCWISSCYRSNR